MLIPKIAGLKPALRLQTAVADHYNLYEYNDYPQLHITIDRINKAKADQAKDFIKEIIAKTDQIKIIINNLKCYYFDNKFLVLKVEETDELVNFSNKIHDKLINQNISTIDNYSEWQFHISLISNSFTQNPIPDQELNQLCSTLDGLAQHLNTIIDRVEIWRPTLDKDKKCIASYKL